MKKLVLLGGPPGVGKSTLVPLLKHKLPQAFILDVDEFLSASTEKHIGNAQSQIIDVLKNRINNQCELIFLSWVFARAELYQPIIAAVEGLFDEVIQVYLTVDKIELGRRLDNHGDGNLKGYAFEKLALISSLSYPKIDTTGKKPETVLAAVLESI